MKALYFSRKQPEIQILGVLSWCLSVGKAQVLKATPMFVIPCCLTISSWYPPGGLGCPEMPGDPNKWKETTVEIPTLSLSCSTLKGERLLFKCSLPSVPIISCSLWDAGCYGNEKEEGHWWQWGFQNFCKPHCLPPQWGRERGSRALSHPPKRARPPHLHFAGACPPPLPQYFLVKPCASSATSMLRLSLTQHPFHSLMVSHAHLLSICRQSPSRPARD